MRQIAELLVQEYNKHANTRAFLLFYKDWNGDMKERKKFCDRFLTKEVTVEESAIVLVGSEIWDDLKGQRMCITETHWWANRRFHYDGQPLDDWWINQIKRQNEQDAAA